jgi:hypothetical protein
LESGDSKAVRGAVVVNRSFAHRILDDENPLGSRVRILGSKDRSVLEYEIVGVVGDLFVESRIPTIYRPLALVADGIPKDTVAYQAHLTVHAGITIQPSLGNRVRQIAAGLDPALRVDELQTLGEIYRLLSIGDIAVGGVVAALCQGRSKRVPPRRSKRGPLVTFGGGLPLTFGGGWSGALRRP